MAPLLRLFGTLGVAGVLVAQDPAEECTQALLRRDFDAAARAVARVELPAARARLQAALLPLAQRPAAMLAVASLHRGEAEADAALLAGAAAALLLMDRDAAVPELAEWTSIEDRDERSESTEVEALAPVVRAMAELADERATAAPASATLQQAQRLLRLATVSRYGLWPARVSVDAPIALPRELAQPLWLRAYRCPLGRLDWHQVDRLGAPAWECELRGDGTAALPVLARGSWLLELSSADGPWRGLRVVEASELDVIGLVDDGVLVLAPVDPGGPTPASWELSAAGARLAQGAVRGAPAVLSIPGGAADERELVMHGPAGSAWLRVPMARRADEPRTEWLAHVMVDRPLYRGGERIHGRVVLRRCTWDGIALEAVPSTAPAPGQPITVTVLRSTTEEATLHGQTDEHGVFPFTCELSEYAEPGQSIAFRIAVAGERDDARSRFDWSLATVQHYQRPAALLAVEGPDEVERGPGVAEIVLRAQWPSGGSAAHLLVHAKVTSWWEGWHDEEYELHTGPDGRATLRIPLQGRAESTIVISFAVTTPDGQQLEQVHRLSVRAAGDGAEPDVTSLPSWLPILVEADPTAVGAECHVRLRGKPNARVLLAAGRGQRARARTVELDERGQGSASVEVLRSDWPYLDLVAATHEGRTVERVAVALHAAQPPAIQLPPRARPGSEVVCRVSTGTTGTIVTASIVDERIFALAEDRTWDPNVALRPSVPYPGWSTMSTPPAGTVAELLESMLEDGRIPRLDRQSWDSSRPQGLPAAGFPAPGDGKGAQLRDDFRATAAFTTVVAGDDGVATIRFTLPDDLTTWRVTLVGIAPDGVSFVERRALDTRLPLAVEPLLPRVLRAGDAIELPLAIDRAADADAKSDSGSVTAGVEGAALQLGTVSQQVRLAAGQVARTLLPLRAVQAGDAKLALGVTLGDHADRSERALPVLRDAVTHPLHVAMLGEQELTLPLPEGCDPSCGMRVDLLQGGAAAWRRIEQDLAQYPYGCVEQTLSKLLPYLAAARSARANGAALPAMDDGYRERLRRGLARMRELQRGDGTFSFWPGGEPEPYMSALVLHGLALLRDGGLEPAAVGLHFDPRSGPFRAAIRHAHQATVLNDRAGITAGELVAGALRLAPADPELLRAVSSLALRNDLPPGLLARLGLALHGAGAPDAARRCRQKSAQAESPAQTGDRLPGEDPLAVAALQLELDLLLGADRATTDQRAAELLLACLRGQGSTYAQACALTALARALPPATPQPGTVTLHAGPEQRELRFDAKAELATTRFRQAADLQVRGPAGMPLLVRVTSERSARASDHRAWATPIQVERELCLRRVHATPKPGAAGPDLVAVAGPLQLGQVYELRLRLRAPVAMSYVVVECPLPAGFEIPLVPADVDRFDDRVAFACTLGPGQNFTRTIPVQPTMTGRVLWPPTTAAPMYAAGLDGGTAGGFVTVIAVDGAVAAPSVVTCRPAKETPHPPAPWPTDLRLPTAIEAFDDAIWSAWSLERTPDAATQRQIETLLAECARLQPSRENLPWLVQLGKLLRYLDPEDPDLSTSQRGWRVSLRERLAALQRQFTSALLRQLRADEFDSWTIFELGQAVGLWADRDARERAVALLLPRALEESHQQRSDLLELLEAPVQDPDLCAALLRMLADPDVDLRWTAFTLLPAAEQQRLPPAVILACQYLELDAGIIPLLCRSEAGRAELAVRLRDPQFVHDQIDMLEAELPEKLWQAVTLEGFQRIGESIRTDFDDDAGPHVRLAARIAASPIPTAALLQELAIAPMPEWRLVLVLALRARGETALPAALRNDPTWQLWRAAAALGDRDAATAVRLLVGIDALPEPFEDEGELLCALVRPVIARAGSVPELLAAQDALPNYAEWRVVYTRLQPRELIELLDRAPQELPTLPRSADADVCAAVWRHARRHDDEESAIDALCESEAGVAYLLAQIRAGDVAREHVAQFAGELGLDPATLAPRTDLPWLAVLRRAARQPLAGTWTPRESATLLGMRALRGVGPAQAR